MIRRLPGFVFAVSVLAALVSCSTAEKAKTPGPVVVANSTATPASEGPPIWTASDLARMIEDKKEMKRAWDKFEHSQKYRLAQPGEARFSPFLIWWGVEAYQGPDFLLAIVVDPSRTDPNRYGLVAIAAPTSAGGKYKPYWIAREQDMSKCEFSPASGGVSFNCVRADGTSEGSSLAWFRSRRQFELKHFQ